MVTAMTFPWRDDPQLAGRFHPDYPDDLQIFVHDGGPRVSKCRPELVWARVVGASNGSYSAKVLNQPLHLKTVKQDDIVQFIVTDSCKYPILVSTKYLEERDRWTIHSCDKCGLSELFDAPSDLIRIIFPNLPPNSKMGMFSSFCPLCGGTQVIEDEDATKEMKKRNGRKWWQLWSQFWK
jgi:hypothetical protein